GIQSSRWHVEARIVGEQEPGWPGELPARRGCRRVHHVQRGRVRVRGHLAPRPRAVRRRGPFRGEHGGESASRRHLRVLLRPVRVPEKHGRPPCRAQPVPQLGRWWPRAPGRTRGGSIGVEQHASVFEGGIQRTAHL
ncbi:MAG: hypothetical protein AVDCRST_MAG25-2870, partial [uncultured Rubrobacteraceae bacterium]